MEIDNEEIKEKHNLLKNKQLVIKVEDEFQISIRIAVLYISSNSFFVILYPLEVNCGFPLRFSTYITPISISLLRNEKPNREN